MTEVAGGDWRAFGPSGPSAADLFNPADFEARLSEARARRKKALAEREGHREVVSPGVTSPTPPMAAGRTRLGFLVGLAAGAVGALAAPYLLSPAPLPAPYAGGLPPTPALPEISIPISFSLGIDAFGLEAQLPALEIVLPEAPLAAPEPWEVEFPALVSKVRNAVPLRLAPLNLQHSTGRSVVSRAGLFQEHRADGRDPGGADITDLTKAFDSTMDPVTPGHPDVGKPARPQKPRANGSRPRPTGPPTAEPRPSTSPKQATQVSRHPSVQGSDNTQRGADARAGRGDRRETAASGQREASGRETANRAGHAEGAPDHARGSGRGDGPGRGGSSENRSGRSNDNGSNGKSSNGKSGNGNGGGSSGKARR